MTNKKEKALQYVRAGYKLMPLWWMLENGSCACGDPDCGNKASANNPGKHPLQHLVRNGRKNSSNDPEVISDWWTKYPEANIGLDCAGSGLIVIDVDKHGDKSNGFESLDDLETTFGEKITSNVTAETGGGGIHMIFRAPPDYTSCPGGFGKNFPAIDLKFNGYILLAPSNHKSGLAYQWADISAEKDFILGKVPPLPAKVDSYIRRGFDENRHSPARYTAPTRPIDQDDEDQILEALSYLDFFSLTDDERLKVGMGLNQALPGSRGKAIYFDWLQSALGSKFNYKFSERRWRSFKFRSGGRTIASFFELAQEKGFLNEGKKGFYIDPNDYVFMEPDLVSEEFNQQIEHSGVMYVNHDVPVPMHVEEYVLPEIMFVDFSAEPEKDELPKQEKKPFMANANIYGSKDVGTMLDMKLEGYGDPQAGMPTEDELNYWRKKLSFNPVMCDLFMWQVQNSNVFVPEIALSFCISVMGAVTAGRFSHGGLTTNTYFMVIADTSVGKTQTIKMAKKVLSVAGDDNRIGPDDIISDKGFINDLAKDPARYFPLDEIGELFANIFDERANASQKMIRKALLSAYTSYGSDFNPTASRADSKNNPTMNLKSICPSIYGMTTPAKIFEALNSKDIVDGLLNRLMIMINDQKGYEGKIPMGTELPKSVGQWLHAVKGGYQASSGVLMPVSGESTPSIEMNVDEDAKILKAKIKAFESMRRNEEGDFGGIYGRMLENVIRVSIIFELASNPYSRMITAQSMLSAFEIISWCLEKGLHVAKNYISDNKEMRIMSDVTRFLRGMPYGASLKELSTRTALSTDVRQRNALLGNLVREGSILEFRVKNKGAGRPSIHYMHPEAFAKLPPDEREGFMQVAKQV
ncbi:putative bifunctional DNA primase/polymerase domain protein [Serratia phage vB_SmaS_Niamh]|nr:putative bifunctional DNA primase/polymerase domain protein [Serratia phage vB_SmaS_Serratianator]UGO53009.1 putative bifunctional DNA primase/polymerase domain protein [Serratia phage vB_SmaS_Niamh]